MNSFPHVCLARPLRRGLAANSTATVFPARAPVTVRPTNDGVIDLTQEGDLVPRFMKLWAIGVGSDNDAFSVRVIGWSLLLDTGTKQSVWFPSPIAELAYILGASAGLGTTVIPSTELIADTVTIVHEGQLSDDTTLFQGEIVRYNPADDTVGWAQVPIYGFQMVEFLFSNTTNTPTKNVLYSLL